MRYTLGEQELRDILREIGANAMPLLPHEISLHSGKKLKFYSQIWHTCDLALH